MTRTQEKNIAWYLPRPKPDKYKGGMPLWCEEWLLNLGRQLLCNDDAKILNLFCGMNKYGMRVDIRPDVKPDVCCDAHELTKHISETFDIILADPPYSNDESRNLYGTKRLNYKKWTSEATLLLNPGGLLIVYHKYIMPNPDPEKYEVMKRVFIGTRVYHHARIALYFRKKANNLPTS